MAEAECEPAWLDSLLITALLAGQRVRKPASCDLRELPQLGLLWDSESIWLPSSVQALRGSDLQRRMSHAAQRLWPNLEVCPAIGSTNSALMALGERARGRALVTEYQFGGRGRRGRQWLSSVGQNLCFSLGLRISGPLDRSAGLSLVVGLAVADALVTSGLAGVQLKWPNDVIVMLDQEHYAKLGGILVELQLQEDECTAVVGIGLNLGGAQAARLGTDAALADIAELLPSVDRSDILVGLLNTLADYLDNFLVQGFAPMKEAWNALHAFHGREVRLHSGSTTESEQGLGQTLNVGTVLGVGDSGTLLLRTNEGQKVEFGAGEVSLRLGKYR